MFSRVCATPRRRCGASSLAGPFIFLLLAVAGTAQRPNTVFVPADGRRAGGWGEPREAVAPATQDGSAEGGRFIGGVYPHLTTYGVYSQGGAHRKKGHAECGIGAIVPWAERLWMVNYAPHRPRGSEHKLFSIDPKTLAMRIHPESVGGTPAGRMIHAESGQLLIGHHLIDATGKIRTISPKEMPIRVTAIARHLEDPKNKVYYVDMEGSLWEANVRTLAVKRLFKKPVPGWHAKGGYSGQGRLLVSNNGELAVGDYRDLEVEDVGGAEAAGVLAEWDGKAWRIVERRQFTDITGPRGIAGGGGENDPIWAIGWDRRSLRLKLLEGGRWSTFLLPKASHCNDPRHGWYTEWPRIREIGGGRWLLDMHGMFFDFPQHFGRENSAGIAPIASHLRYIPDFCEWNGRLVLASNETSVQGNPLAGQPQSSLWFGRYEELASWGPASAYGGPWIRDQVAADTPSDPFLIAGFDRRVLHLATHAETQGSTRSGKVTFTLEIDRTGSGRFEKLASVALKSGGGYTCYSIPQELKAIWLRLRADQAVVATAYLHQTDARDTSVEDSAVDFEGLADVRDKRVMSAHLFAAQRNRNLRVLAGNRAFEFDKSKFEFKTDAKDEKFARRLEVSPTFSVDEASVVVEYRGRNWRLPKGAAAFDRPFDFGWPRSGREVESERRLANIHGTFYEIPLISNGAPPAIDLMRPVASHSKKISDFCSWNGLLVLAGLRPNAKASERVYLNDERTMGLWFGGIDDLWKLGKPVGRGGPWVETTLEAGGTSDPYLMTGYDRKQLLLRADRPTVVQIEIDFDHQSGWHLYDRVTLEANKGHVYVFPRDFSAHWVRFLSEQACRATALLRYD